MEKETDRELLERLDGAQEFDSGRIATLESQLAAAQALIAELESDKDRFDFILSVLNEWEAFDEFVNAYHPTRRTTQRRAEDSEWRKTIDAARQKEQL